MKNKKSLQNKLVTAAVTSAFIITAPIGPIASENVLAATKFIDVPAGAFYEKAVENLSINGVIGGYEDGTFKPSKAVTRAEAAKMLAGDLGLLQELTQTTVNFKDVKNGDWFYQPVTALSQAGGIGGYENGTFQPNKTITRAEMASMLMKAYSLEENPEAQKAPFSDVAPNSWYAKAVQTLYGNKITSGKSATKFAPNDPVTRGEIAAFINKVNEANVSKNTITSTIEIINDDSTIIIGGQVYKITSMLNGILNSSNSTILTNAKISFEEQDGQITKITYLQLNTNGLSSPATKEFSNNLVLDGKGKIINGTLEVNANYLTVKNLSITGNLEITQKLTNDFYSEKLTVKGQTLINGGDSDTVVFNNANLDSVSVTKKGVHVETKGNTSIQLLNINTDAHVTADQNASIQKATINNDAKDVQLDGPFGNVEVKTSQTTLKGNAVIKELRMNQNANLSIDIKNKIAKLVVEKGSKISLGANTIIGTLELPNGIKVTDVISNYESVKNNIGNTSSVVGGGGGAAGGSTSVVTNPIVNKYKSELDTLKETAKKDFTNLLSDYLKGNITMDDAKEQGKEKFNGYQSTFDTTYDKLVNELEKNGYSENDAKVVQDEFNKMVAPYQKYLNEQ